MSRSGPTGVPGPAVAAPRTARPSAPVPSAPVPSAPVPSAPVPSAPVSSAPVPSTPVSSGLVPSAPVRAAPATWAIRRRWAVVAVAAALGFAAVGCTGPGASRSSATPSPFAECVALTAAPSAPPGSPAAGPTDLPELRLPCFTGGQPVDVSAIRGPAVLNFWASSCLPCRTELPVMQDLADRTVGRLHVIGVDTGDRRDAGASFAADHRVTLPTLFDADQKLLRAVGGRALPTTVFIDAAGRRSVYLLPLDAPGLAEQVRARTGVTVRS